MKNKVFRFFYKAHVYLGLFVAVHFIVLSLSGSLLLFKDELESEPQVTATEQSAVPMSLSYLMTEVLHKYPGERPLALFADEEHGEILNVRLGMNDSKMFRGARKLTYDAFTGKEIVSENKSSFLEWVLRLHREFLLGSTGKIYVGFIGLLYVFVMISGFIIYGNFAKKLAFGEIRIKSPRHWFSDLHRFLGMAVFAWGVLIGGTGFFLGVSSTLIKVYQYQELKDINAQYKDSMGTHDGLHAASILDQVVKTSEQALPDSKVDYIAFPDTQFSPPNHFLVVMVGRTPQTERFTQLVVVDAATGMQGEVRQLPWYLKISLASEPLHFGNYGGMILKITWLGFSLLSLLLPILGLAIWARKKKKIAAGSSTETVKLGKGSLLQSPYAVPMILLAVTTAIMVGAFILGGVLAQVAGWILILPLAVGLRGLWMARGGRL
ncbi:MAG: PepSY domain-containing protein [Bdellovibrio sp.]|nr:PepSY domain-containing protein [Bdellovibrio sp.]